MNTAPIMNQPTDNTPIKSIEKPKRKQVKNACGKLIFSAVSA